MSLVTLVCVHSALPGDRCGQRPSRWRHLPADCRTHHGWSLPAMTSAVPDTRLFRRLLPWSGVIILLVLRVPGVRERRQGRDTLKCIYVCASESVGARACARACVRACACVNVKVYRCPYAFACTIMRAYICVRVHACVMCVCMFVCVRACVEQNVWSCPT